MKIATDFQIQTHNYKSFMGAVSVVSSHNLIYVRLPSAKGLSAPPSFMDMRIMP